MTVATLEEVLAACDYHPSWLSALRGAAEAVHERSGQLYHGGFFIAGESADVLRFLNEQNLAKQVEIAQDVMKDMKEKAREAGTDVTDDDLQLMMFCSKMHRDVFQRICKESLELAFAVDPGISLCSIPQMLVIVTPKGAVTLRVFPSHEAAVGEAAEVVQRIASKGPAN